MIQKTVHNPFAKIFVILALFLAFACSKEPPPAPPPMEPVVPDAPFSKVHRIDMQQLKDNIQLIIFIVIDTLRADYVGALGSERGLTANLDGFAKTAFTFDMAFSTSSWTRSSIASMFTSCYSGAIGVETRDDVLSEDLLTLAEVLKTQGGFHTVAVSSNGNAGREVGFAQGFDIFHNEKLAHGYPGGWKKPIAEGVSLDGLRYIKEWQEGKMKQKPMFLFLHYVDPHDPYLPHPEIMDTPEPPGRFDGSRAELKKMDSLPVAELTDADKKRIEYLYSGEVKYCDIYIGELLEAAAKMYPQLNHKSMIIITADHGEGLWVHDHRAHGHDLHKELLHVPLLIRFPGMTQEDGRKISAPVSLVDLAPTILTYCGLSLPSFQFQGCDLMPLIQGMKRDEPYRYIYSELKLDIYDYEAIVEDGRKVIRNRGIAPHLPEAFQMYDWSKDPLEMEDLTRSTEPVKWSKAMKVALRKWGETVQSSCPKPERIDLNALDEETIDNLKALGYLGGDSEGP